MELKQLRAFVAVAEIQSFNKAAKSIFVSQPTLSYQISTLENELGVKLFVRDNPNVYLTPAAVELLPQVKSVLCALDNIKFSLTAGPEKSPEHVLNVCFSGIPIHDNFILASQLVSEFEGQPGHEVHYNRASISHCIDALLNAELDLAFFGVHECDKLPIPLLFHPIDEDRLVLLVSASAPADLTFKQAVVRYPMVLVEHLEGSDKELSLIFTDSGITPDIRYVDTLDHAYELVIAGEAALIWPKKDYEKYLKRNMNAVEIPTGRNKLFYGVSWNNGNLKPILTQFLSTLPRID